MAENIDMDRIDNAPEEEEIPAEKETSFTEDPNRSIDTSVPDIRRDAATFKRAYTQDKKIF